MQIEVITQSVIGNTHWRCIGDVLNTVSARTDCRRFRFAVAYMRVSGLRLLYGRLQSLCDHRGHVSGAVGIDQGITTIEALELLRQLSSDSTIVCTVSNYIYHPKLYLVEGDKWACAVVGSANLTRDGLYRNVELSTIIHLDLTYSADIEIYQFYNAFLSELLNPSNSNVQPLNEATLKLLAEMVIVEDEAHMQEPQSVIQSRSVTAKLKNLFPSLPVPSVPTASEGAIVPNTGKETPAVPLERIPSRFHKERSLLLTDEVASISSTITSLSSLSEGKLAEASRGETTFSLFSTKEEMLNLLRQGAVVWNQWRKEHPDIQPDLSEMDLRGANLRIVDFRWANLSGADMSGSFLAGANLSNSDLRNASFREASLYRANLSGANLSGADLQGTFLRKANLFETNLADTKLERADFYEANLQEANIDGDKREKILSRQVKYRAMLKKTLEKQDERKLRRTAGRADQDKPHKER